MNFCSNCGAPWVDSAPFCATCGTRAATPVQVTTDAFAQAGRGRPVAGVAADVSLIESQPAIDATDHVSSLADETEWPPEYDYVVVETPSQVDLHALWRKVRIGVPSGVVAAAASAVCAVVLLATVAATVLGILLLAVVADGDRGVPVDWIRAGVYGVIAALGGVVSTRSSEGDPFDEDAGAVVYDYTFAPLVVTLIFAGLLYVGVRRLVLPRLAGRPWSESVGAMAVANLVIWLGLLLLGLASEGALTWAELDGSTFEALSWRALLVSAVIVWVVGAAALTPASSDAAGHPLWARVRRGWRFASGLLVATAAIGAVGAALMAAFDGALLEEDPLGFGPDWLAYWALIPNISLVLAGMLHGGSATSSWDGTSSDAMGLFAGGLPALAYASVAVMLFVALAAGVRHALRRPLGARTWEGAWVAPLFYAAFWGLLAVFTRATFESATSDDLTDPISSSWFGLGVVGVILCGLLWAFVGLMGGRLVARWAAGWFPVLSAGLAGRRLDPGWALLLGERLHRDGRRVPRFLSARAALAGDGTAVPAKRLSSGHGTITSAALATTVALTLLLIPTASASFCGLPVVAQFKDTQSQPSSGPPANVQSELDGLQAAVDSATMELNAAEAAAGNGASLRDAHLAAEDELYSAEQWFWELQAAVAGAEKKVNRLTDVGKWERDWLDMAREDYEEFKAYDDDGSWLQEVEDAEDDLYRAEAPLRRAQAELEETRQELAAAETAVANAEAAERRTSETFAPYETKLAALSDATSAADRAEADLENAQDAWEQESASAQAAVADYNTQVEQCHSEAVPRTVPAGTLFLGVVFVGPLWLIRRGRRRNQAAGVPN